MSQFLLLSGRKLWLTSIGACLCIGGLLLWTCFQPDSANHLVTVAARAIDLHGHEVPRQHWILPDDFNHDFVNGPALHLEDEDYWQSFLSRIELSRNFRSFIVKDKEGVRIFERFGDHPKKFYVDKHGQPVFKRSFDLAHPFSDGLAAVSSEVASRLTKRTTPLPIWHFINRTGNTAFPGKFEQATQFHCGRAVVLPVSVSADSQDEHPICIDTHGQKVFGGEFTWMGVFSEGCAPVFTEGNPDKTGLVDINGKFLVRGIRFENFSQGLGAFKDAKTKLYGYADRAGIVRIAPQFIYARNFSEGLAVVGARRRSAIPNWQIDQRNHLHVSEGIPSNLCSEEEIDGHVAAAFVTREGKLLNVQLREPKGDIEYAWTFQHGISYINLYHEREVLTDFGCRDGLKSRPACFLSR